MAGSNKDLFPTDIEQNSDVNAKAKKYVKKALSSVHPSFLVHSLFKYGCPVNYDDFVCQTCPEDNPLVAGYDTVTKKIVICSDKAVRLHKLGLEMALVHELVHALDDCRAHVDWKNPEHYACSEIRAVALSQECAYGNRKTRGHYAYGDGEIENCIKPRAVATLKSSGVAETDARRAVLKVYPHCFEDTVPYDFVPLRWV